jgi:hypothetical protein
MLSTGNGTLNVAIKNELANSSSLKSTHQVTAEWNYNAYVLREEIGCSYGDGTPDDDGYQQYSYTVGADPVVIKDDTDRIKYTPLQDVFKINRPDPGIIHVVGNDIGGDIPINGDGDSLAITRIFNLISEDTRVYPISNEASFKYWNSFRWVYNAATSSLKKVGFSAADKTIEAAKPFVKYKEDINVNKIVIKTQKHLGYPTDFTIQGWIEDPADNTYKWTTLKSYSSSTALSDGILKIYYDKTTNTWEDYVPAIDAPNEKVLTDFSLASSSTKLLKGLRFNVTKMSVANIPLEVIEISPRLIADVTNSVINLSVNSSIGNSSYGLPIGSIVSANGSLTLSDTEQYFSKNNPLSIIKDYMKPNVEIRIYQKLTIGVNDYRFPVKTMYTGIWQEQDGFNVSVELEDYFKFFKESAAPDLIIANNSGVPTSVAMLMLMDNIGFTGFRMDKTSPNNDYEDVVLDFFYSQKEQTIMEVLESLAISTQTAIYMDVDNDLVAMTKEKTISPENKAFWIIGNDGVTNLKTSQDSVTETPLVDIGYLSNIASFSESSEPPITDINVQYNGLGLERKSMSLLQNTDKKQQHLESPSFGASFINKDLRYTPDIVWQPGNEKGSNDNYLAAAALIKDVWEEGPSTSTYFSTKTRTASSKSDAIKAFFDSTERKNVMSIYLDKEMINTFTNSYSGYVMIDAEVIRYEGISFFISNPKEGIYKREIIFNQDEYNFEKSKIRQGGSIEPQSLIVYLDLEKEISPVDPTKNIYTLVGDGRGQNKTEIVKHFSVDTSKEFLNQAANRDWFKAGVHLWGAKRELPQTIINGLTVTNRIDTFMTTKTSGIITSKSIPGYIKLSAAKSGDQLTSTRTEAQSIKDFLPMNTTSEQIVSGIFKPIKNANGKAVPIRRIGTRMRLVSDVPKNVSPGQQTIENSVIGGIAWSVDQTSQNSTSGLTGYFLEVEDTGTIDDQSLLNQTYRNLRLYKVYLDGGKHKVKVLKNSWVNVSSTPSSAADMGTALVDAKGNDKSYAQIFELEAVIRDSGGTRYYEVWWENQMVLQASEPKSSIAPETNVAGLITRGKSSAIFEYLYVLSTPDDFVVPRSGSVITKSKDSKISSLASRGMLPESLMLTIDKNNVFIHFEDFGRYVREVKKLNVRFNNPTLAPKIISLSESNPNYYVSQYAPTAFGSEFWLYNTANNAIQIDEASQTPLWISGFALKEISPGVVQSSKTIEKQEFDKDINDKYTINRNLYGKQEILLSGKFINRLDQAKSLADWVIDNLSQERKSINVEVFPNPLFELGDKVGLLYDDKNYDDLTKTYSIVSISHNISNGGPSMSLEIRECV